MHKCERRDSPSRRMPEQDLYGFKKVFLNLFSIYKLFLSKVSKYSAEIPIPNDPF